jgi:amino acid transporter
MPIVIASQLLLPRSLPYRVAKAAPPLWWSAEVAIALGEASLAAVFWIVVGKARRIRTTSSAGVVAATAISIVFSVLAVWAFHDALQAYRQFLNDFPRPADWFAYISATRFSETSLVAPTVIMLFGVWCFAAAACISSPVLRHLRHDTT